MFLGSSGFGTMSFGGIQPQQNAPIGTTIRFVPVSSTDTIAKSGTNPSGPTQIQTRHQNISAMKEYEQKSVEELRLEDYNANRKGPPAGTAAPFGGGLQSSFSFPQQSFGFGASSSTPVATSTPSTSIFGSQTPSGFGQSPQNQMNQPKLFGTGTTSLFGNNTANQSTAPTFGTTPTQNTFGFGTSPQQPAAAPSLFSGQPQASTSTSTSLFGFGMNNQQQTQPKLFGNTTTTSLFGNITSTQPSGQATNQPPASTSSTSIFGSNPTTGFGQTPQNQMNQSKLFGTATPSLFGNTTATQSTAPAFGTPPTQNTFGFGATPQQPAAAPSLFSGQTQTAATGSTSLFGFGLNNQTQTQPKLFGATTTPSLFGITPSQPAAQQATQPPTSTPSTSIFGNQTTTPFGQTPQNTSLNQPKLFGTGSTTSLFGNTTATQSATPAFGTTPTQNTFGFGATPQQPAAAPSLFSGQTQTAATGSTSLFGFGLNNQTQTQPKLFTNTTTTSLFGTTVATEPTNQPNNNSNLLLNRLKALPYGTRSLELSFGSGNGLNPLKFTTDPKTISTYKMSAKTNVSLDKSVSSEKAKAVSVLFDELDDGNCEDLRCGIDVFVPKKNIKKLVLSSDSTSSITETDRNEDEFNDSPLLERTSNFNTSNRSAKSNNGLETSENISTNLTIPDSSFNDSNTSFSIYPSKNRSQHSVLFNTSENRSNVNVTPPIRSQTLKCGVVSTRRDYILKPNLETIEKQYNPENGTCMIDSLLIDRPGYGSILFEEKLNVRGINLDETVHIRRKEVIVYPDDEKKPPVGKGLNKPAIITLHQVWPIDKSTKEVIRDVDRLLLMKYPERIEAATIEKGARFLEYRPETGSWVFAVQHFSKYGITDDDEDSFSKSALSFKAPQVQPPQQQQQPQPQPQPQPQLQTQQYPPQEQNQLLALHEQSQQDQSMSQTSFSFFKDQSSLAANALFANETKTISKYKMSPKTNLSLNKSFASNNKRSLVVHGTKKLALQSLSPNVSNQSLHNFSMQQNLSVQSFIEKPLGIVGRSSLAPTHPKILDLKTEPDLYPAYNKLIRDISSMCVLGSPRVKFMNGSRSFCLIQGSFINIYNLELVETKEDKSLSDEVQEKFSTFLLDNSKFRGGDSNKCLDNIYTDQEITTAYSYELLHALYGHVDSKTPYDEQNTRLQKVVKWLASVNFKLPVPSNIYHKILYYMACDRYDVATSEALKSDHPHLALLVASLNLNKHAMHRQLKTWSQHGADQFIDRDLLKIYVLLSGNTEYTTSDNETLNCLNNLTWTQQLCLFILHSILPTAAPREYGFKLIPLYIQSLSTDTDDVDYHIIARHDPSVILSASSSLLDEWFLLESLKSFNIVNLVDSCNNDRTDIVHCNLAAQLGSIDLRWSCFVALHIVNPEIRNHVLITCLEQNVRQLKEDRRFANGGVMSVENWLRDYLKIPSYYIDNAKKLLPNAK